MNRELPMGLQLAIIHRAFLRKTDERLRETGLTGVQFAVLGQLVRLEEKNAGEVSQRDLETATRVTHPTMTEIVKRLEKKEFICCCRGKNDRRYKSVSSTGKTILLLREMSELDESVFGELCRGIEGAQTAAFKSAVAVMLKNAAAEDCGKEDIEQDV